MFMHFRGVIFKYGDKVFEENRGIMAAPNFFSVFSLPLIEGDPSTVLAKPGTIVLTESMAQKFFGENDPMGKVLTINNRDLTVAGILEDISSHSHFKFDSIVTFTTWPQAYESTRWTFMRVYTYALLREDASVQALEEKFPEMVVKYAGPQWEKILGIPYKDYQEAGNDYIYFLQPLREIHLRSHLDFEIEANSDITYVYIFSVIAVFILIIACINFMNLATARSAGRAREVGVRKVLGSFRKQLMSQFLFESILLSTFSLVLALLMVKILLPQFNELSGKQLAFGLLSNWVILPALIGLSIIVGLLAGTYPAFFLSAFRPTAVLKGQLLTGVKKTTVRSVLVVFQFFLSTTLIICTIAAHRQLIFLVTKDLGFDKENVLLIDRIGLVRQQKDAFKQELLSSPDIINASSSSGIPGWQHATGVFADGADPSKETSVLSYMAAGYEFLDTLKIELVAGRNFSREFGQETDAVLINEATVKAFGWDHGVGKKIVTPGEEAPPLTVIGVIKDYHFESLHHRIAPLLIRLWDGPAGCVRIRSNNVPATIDYIKNTWKKFVPQEAFRFSFLDENLMTLYKAEETTRILTQIFSLLAIIIACLGLFGLAAFTAEQRTKEIGIRKVLGASIPGIVGLLSKQFARWVGISIIFAWPVAWFTTRSWLKSFAFHISLGVDAFFLGGFLAIIIALVTVSYQALKASLADPIDSLRYE
jgi:putative ABC transport system permease protein